MSSFFNSFLEKDPKSNVAFGLLACIYYLVSTQLDLEMYTQHFLLLCTGMLAYALTFQHRTSTFVMRLFLLSIPYLSLFTKLNGDLEIESEVWKSTMNFFFCVVIPIFILHLYRILQQKHHLDLELEVPDGKVASISNRFEQRCNFHMQDLQMELKRRQLAREIIEYSELGGINIEPRFLQKDICSQDIHHKIKMLIELQNHEQRKKEKVEESKKMRSLYIEYKESLMSS